MPLIRASDRHVSNPGVSTPTNMSIKFVSTPLISDSRSSDQPSAREHTVYDRRVSGLLRQMPSVTAIRML